MGPAEGLERLGRLGGVLPVPRPRRKGGGGKAAAAGWRQSLHQKSMEPHKGASAIAAALYGSGKYSSSKYTVLVRGRKGRAAGRSGGWPLTAPACRRALPAKAACRSNKLGRLPPCRGARHPAASLKLVGWAPGWQGCPSCRVSGSRRTLD